jgi:3-methyladenine DNA glycosylase/8-oxoguanine DNA glycosylase
MIIKYFLISFVFFQNNNFADAQEAINKQLKLIGEIKKT